MSVTGHQYTSTRVRGLAAWNPKPATIAVLEAVSSVLDEYRAYLPLTARQIFYRLVGAHSFDKTELASNRLLEYLNRGRRSGIIPWHAIRDDGFDSIGGGGWDNPQQVIDSTIRRADNYRRDHQDGQDVYIELWVEAAGMMPQVEGMVDDFSIPVYSSGGFNSTTAKYETATRIKNRWFRDDRKTLVLHIGDYDPSGVAIIDSLADDIDAFLWDTEADPDDAAEFRRVAIIPQQIEELDLPGAPAKKTDKRGNFTDLTVQAEALSPPQLESIILNAVVKEWDQGVYEALLVTEAAERLRLINAVRDLELET